MICPKCNNETNEYICTNCDADLIAGYLSNRNPATDDLLATYIKEQSIKGIYQSANGFSKEDVEDISQNTFLKGWKHHEHNNRYSKRI
mgnify:CR=1 FL=1